MVKTQIVVNEQIQREADTQKDAPRHLQKKKGPPSGHGSRSRKKELETKTNVSVVHSDGGDDGHILVCCLFSDVSYSLFSTD